MRWIRKAIAPRGAQRGATLLEAVAFLGVSAIVITGVLSLFGISFTGASADRLVQETSAIATNVRALYSSSGSGGYQAMSMSDMVTEGIFPTSMQVTGTGASVAVYNQWGGTVSVSLGANGQPQVMYTGVPRNICIQALMASNNWTQITVNSTTYAPTMTIAQTQTACSGATGNAIAWGFV